MSIPKIVDIESENGVLIHTSGTCRHFFSAEQKEGTDLNFSNISADTTDYQHTQ
jgi:hypothetical protein